jgi:hypothetical protein
MKYYLLITFSIFLLSCTDKKYTYREGGKEQIITAPNNSAAYAEAVKLFEISKIAHESVEEAFGNYNSIGPIDFELVDQNGKEVIEVVDRDSIRKAVSELGQGQKERLKEVVNSARFKDTIGTSGFPVKILKAVFSHEEYSNYKSVSLSYKNTSGKKIDAIRFKWYGENSFGEPADMTGIIKGWGGGFDDSGLGVGKTGYGTWDVYSKDGKKIIVAYPTEIAFSDGTKWENPN